MKLKEYIEKLNKLDPDLDVVFVYYDDVNMTSLDIPEPKVGFFKKKDEHFGVFCSTGSNCVRIN